eukprot:6179635-Pleurochrysis_carterae.AAC.3
MDVLDKGMDERVGNRFAQHCEKRERGKDSSKRAPVRRDELENCVDVLVGVAGDHPGDVPLLRIALLDHPAEEAEDPAAFVVPRVVELHAQQRAGR